MSKHKTLVLVHRNVAKCTIFHCFFSKITVKNSENLALTKTKSVVWTRKMTIFAEILTKVDSQGLRSAKVSASEPFGIAVLNTE